MLVGQTVNCGREEIDNILFCALCHSMAFSARKVQLGLVTSTASTVTAKMHHELGSLSMQKGKILFACLKVSLFLVKDFSSFVLPVHILCV